MVAPGLSTGKEEREGMLGGNKEGSLRSEGTPSPLNSQFFLCPSCTYGKEPQDKHWDGGHREPGNLIHAQLWASPFSLSLYLVICTMGVNTPALPTSLCLCECKAQTCLWSFINCTVPCEHKQTLVSVTQSHFSHRVVNTSLAGVLLIFVSPKP